MGTLKIVYITGFWRSGGTLLGRILGTSEQIIFVGNIKDFWRKGLKLNRKCSCGEKFETCDFWKNVTREYTKSFPTDNFEELRKEFRHIEKSYNFFKLRNYVFNKKVSALNPVLDKYLKHNERLFEIVSDLSRKKIIVDSSRNPGRLLALSLLNKFELYPVNFIRDPRGVINSLINKDLSNYKEIRHSTILNLLHWNIKNYFNMNIMKKLYKANSIIILYKYFTLYTINVIAVLKKSLGFTLDNEIENGKFSIYLDKGHVFSGNRKRHESGKFAIREDLDWERELNWRHRLLTDIISIPFYNYLVKKYNLYSDGVKTYPKM